MKILSVTGLRLAGVKVIRFARFRDQRGYFTESFRRSDIDAHSALGDLRSLPFLQMNESYSDANVLRGLHFQHDPAMGKLVRTLHGHMVDIVLDIRKGSPTLGKAVMHDLPAQDGADWAEWIWVPPGFAHGIFFLEASRIEYYCTAEYSPAGEATISPFAADIDWSLCDPGLKSRFDAVVAAPVLVSDKDRHAPDLQKWLADSRSECFTYQG